MKGYVYIPFLLVVLIALGFVLSGGIVLSKQFFLPTKSTGQYKLVDKGALSPNSTLQLSTLDFIPCSLGGIDIALVIDRSSSIDGSELSQIKTEVKSFINTLSPTSTEFSITVFGTTASVIKEFTSKIGELTDTLDSISTTTSEANGPGATNWQDALIKAESTLPGRSNSDLIIFISDGTPTKYYDVNNILSGPGNSTDQATLDAAISIAERIKAGGTTILTLGIGDSLVVENLEKISGAGTSGLNFSTYTISTNFNTINSDLSIITATTCSGP